MARGAIKPGYTFAMEATEEFSEPSRAQRSRQILAVLAKHGLAVAGGGGGEHARLACEELGTTFIKIGQMLSTRADLLPRDYRDELAKLQDHVPPIDAAEIERVVETELGAPIAQLFASFDPQPLACASIGQVHAARLADGTEIVVKVRKPEVRPLVESDLDVLNGLVKSSEKYFPDLAGYDVEGLLEEFADTLRAELDYTREARNIETFAGIFADDAGIELPEVLFDYSTAHVLTMTAMEGANVSELPPLTPRRREAASSRIARFVLEPALSTGIFHADPHPGNVLVRRNGSVGFVDFGMVATLPDATRRQVADLFLALQHRDAVRLVDRLFAIAPPARPVDRNALTHRIARLLNRYMSQSLERMEIGAALDELLELVRIYELRPPATLALLFKAVAMSESLIAAISPNKTLGQFLEPIAKRVGMARLSPQDWTQRAQAAAMEAAELSIELPRRADRVLADVERGNLRIWTQIEELEPSLRRLERMVERANASVIAAACIVGMTVLLAVYHPAAWRAAIAWTFWIALVIAAIVVFRTALATVRSRTR
jgi:ubiquinone biosynthesis protein